MPHKKQLNPQPADDPVLVEKVDAMMDIRFKPKPLSSPDAVTPVATPTISQPAQDQPAAIDIFKDMHTKPPILDEVATPAAVPTTEPAAEPAPPTKQPIPPTVQPAQSVVDLEAAVLDKAVDEIVVAEGDALLAAEDIAATVATLPKQPKRGLGYRLKHLFS